MARILCDEDVAYVKKRLEDIDKFLSLYGWLMNSYTTDYFSLDIKLPYSFREALLKDCSLTDLAGFLPNWTTEPQDDPVKSQHVLPLSMLAFKKLCRQLTMYQGIHSATNSKMDGHVFGTSMEKFFRVCVKAKKRHEVDILSEVISSLCKQTGCNHVVDVGAGLGHLSRLLTFNKQLTVTTIEATDAHSPKAQRLDRQTASLLNKDKGKVGDSTAKPNHISHWISSDISADEFVRLISRQRYGTNPETASAIISDLSIKMDEMLSGSNSAASADQCHGGTAVSEDDALPYFDLPWSNNWSDSNSITASLASDYPLLVKPQSVAATYNTTLLQHKRAHTATRHPATFRKEAICLSGLHACGDLSTTLLRVFVKLECGQLLSSVACCYMKLSYPTHDGDTADVGFPMSQYARDLPHHHNLCTYESLEMACHSLSQYRQRLASEELSLKRHVVRAALQTLLYSRKKKSEIQFKRLKIKDSEKLPFREYVERAFSKLGLPFDVTEGEIEDCEKLIETHWRAVVGMYTVRLALAPLVEAYILLDRMLFLHEHGIKSRLVPIFDPAISPRNMVLIASKNRNFRLESLI